MSPTPCSAGEPIPKRGQMRWSDPPTEDELRWYLSFSTEIDEATGCWNWTRGVDGSGYASLFAHKRWKASRFVYTVLVGPIPKGLNALHHCDNARCVNPEHIYLGNQSQNALDAFKRKRFARLRNNVCRNGHPLTPENTAMHGEQKHCVKCRRARNLRGYYSRAKRLADSARRAEREEG